MVLVWDVTLEVVTVNGDATSYYLDSASHLVQEPDCVRIIGSTTHDVLQKVGTAIIIKSILSHKESICN